MYDIFIIVCCITLCIIMDSQFNLRIIYAIPTRRTGHGTTGVGT